MLCKTTCAVTLIALLSFQAICPLVSAQTVNIAKTSRGWYTPSGQHVGNSNYVVGDVRGPVCGPICSDDIRNFFVFDLSSVTRPIASAKLALLVPSQPGQGYASPAASENYELHDVVTPLGPLMGGTGGVAAHVDLGSGIVYGSRTMTAADIGRIVEITLNSSAIAALDAATGLIGIGGSITTLDGLANNEYTFAYSNSGTETTQLRLTLVPEPTTLLLIGISAISLLGFRKPKSRGWPLVVTPAIQSAPAPRPQASWRLAKCGG